LRDKVRSPIILLPLIILGFLLILLGYAWNFHADVLTKKVGLSTPSTAQLESPINSRVPTRLRIPKLYINEAIEPVGLTLDGAMEVPSNSVNVGWFRLGTLPGEPGSAVITGHFDGNNGTAGVFNKLHTLVPGDTLSVEDDQGQSTFFIVRESRIYSPTADAPDVFNEIEGNHLNLITCDGAWDHAKKSYAKRLVVFTDEVRSD
jgi:sortase A